MTKIDAIKNRLAKATPGPWESGMSRDGRRCFVINQNKPGEELKVILEYSPNDLPAIRKLEKIANVRFIAHAPADLALLLKIVERQAVALRFYQAPKNWTGPNDGEYTEIIDADCYRNTNMNDELFGGLMARQALSDVEKLLEVGDV